MMSSKSQSATAASAPLSRTRVSLLIALAVMAGPLLVTPLVIHSSNALNFDITLLRAFWWLVPTFLLGTLALWLLLLGSKRFFVPLSAVCIALAWLFWLQGHLLVWDYGVLDGRAIDWLGQWKRGALDTAIWIALLATAWLFSTRLKAHLGLAAGALLAIYAATALGSLLTAKPTPAFHRFSLDETHKYDFSAGQNVILLVLDAFQSDVMAELLESHPQLKQQFSGFTYYRNMSAGFAKTYPSIPLMFTGAWYANDQPIEEFVEDAFNADSFTGPMLETGWRVDLFPAIPRVIHHAPQLTSNLVVRGNPVTLAEDSGRLLDLSLFRISPHFLKGFWLNDSQWRISPLWGKWATGYAGAPYANRVSHPNKAASFALSVERFGAVAWDQPAFKFYHLLVPHEPFMLNEDFEHARLPSGREGFVIQSAASLKVANHLLERLRTLGIYEQSSIFIVSDHGGGDYAAGIRQDLMNAFTAPAEGERPNIPSQRHDSALSLLLVKPAGAYGDLQVSDKPVSLGDLAASIAIAAGLPKSPPGRDIDSIGIDEERSRRYFFYRHQGWDGAFLPPMTEYRLRGHSWDPNAWSAVKRSSAGQEGAHNSYGYELGTRAKFNGTGNPDSWLESGWSGSDSGGTWSNADRAQIRVPLSEPLGWAEGANLEAQFFIHPFLGGGQIAAQTVRVSVDEVHSQWSVGAPGCYSIGLNDERFRGMDELLFQFEFPDARAPADFALSEDYRTLAALLIDMEIGEPGTLEPGQTVGIPLAKALRCAINLVGWSVGENAAWSDAPVAGLELELDGEDFASHQHIEIALQLRPYLGDGQLTSQRVLPFVNGHPLEPREVKTSGLQRLVVPASWLHEGHLSIRLQLPDAVAPKTLGLSGDIRTLGLHLSSITVNGVSGEE